jgi:[ribosomal protein S5]-alanine N-acetyltransferase
VSTAEVHFERKGNFSRATRLLTTDLDCVPFSSGHVSAAYLGWLNDPEVNRYSRRRFVRSTEEDAREFLAALPSTNQIMAMIAREDGRHVGNLQLGPLDLEESHGEVRILIGEKAYWGRGLARQALHAACSYFFQVLGLHRVEAMSCNPGFIRAAERVGWKDEGRLRERFPDLDGARLDYRCLGILRPEFTPTAIVRERV